MPHIHALYFRIPYLEKEDVTAAWARAINWANKRVSVKLQEIKNLRMCLYYVAKYVSKVDECNLDIASYLAARSPGRMWGIYRKNLLPLADRTEMRIIPGEAVEVIRSIARNAYDKIPLDKNKGFTVFGPVAAEIQNKIDEFCRQGQVTPVYCECTEGGGQSS